MADAVETKKTKISLDKGRIIPLILTGIVIFLDQLSKYIIVSNWPRVGTIIKDVFNNDFLLIHHVRNKAIAFSLGHDLPEPLKPFIFIVLPLVVLCFLLWYYLVSPSFANSQRWAMAGIIG